MEVEVGAVWVERNALRKDRVEDAGCGCGSFAFDPWPWRCCLDDEADAEADAEDGVDWADLSVCDVDDFEHGGAKSSRTSRMSSSYCNISAGLSSAPTRARCRTWRKICDGCGPSTPTQGRASTSRTHQVIQQAITPHDNHIILLDLHRPLFRIFHRFIATMRANLHGEVEAVCQICRAKDDVSFAYNKECAVAEVG